MRTPSKPTRTIKMLARVVYGVAFSVPDYGAGSLRYGTQKMVSTDARTVDGN